MTSKYGLSSESGFVPRIRGRLYNRAAGVERNGLTRFARAIIRKLKTMVLFQMFVLGGGGWRIERGGGMTLVDSTHRRRSIMSISECIAMTRHVGQSVTEP